MYKNKFLISFFRQCFLSHSAYGIGGRKKTKQKKKEYGIWNNNAHTLIYSYWSNNRFYTKTRRMMFEMCRSDCSRGLEGKNKETVRLFGGRRR